MTAAVLGLRSLRSGSAEPLIQPQPGAMEGDAETNLWLESARRRGARRWFQIIRPVRLDPCRDHLWARDLPTERPGPWKAAAWAEHASHLCLRPVDGPDTAPLFPG